MTASTQTRSRFLSPVSSNEDATRLPSLDGLRAVSIALVFLGHLSGTKGFPNLVQIGDYAHLGVVAFFVISGFLITRLMLLEHAKFGDVSLRLFYARRALRLLPAAYTYTLCVGLMWAAGFIQLHSRDMWHVLTYTVNYQIDRSWDFGHLWSLSVEEQFYLLWPFMFVLFKPKRAHWAPLGAMLRTDRASRSTVPFQREPLSRLRNVSDGCGQPCYGVHARHDPRIARSEGMVLRPV